MKKIYHLAVMIALIAFAPSCKKNDSVGSGETDALSTAKDGLVTLKSGVVVEKKGVDFYWEGDIHLSKIQLDNLDKYGNLLDKKPDYVGFAKNIHPAYNIPFENSANGRVVPRAFSIYPTPYNLWAMVRIIYGSNLSIAQRQHIASALQEIEANTNVRFYNATCEPITDPTYGFQYPNIEFWSIGDSDVSTSPLGRQGGVQRINLGDFAFDYFWLNNVIIHEVFHSLGMRHEHTRIDRDNNVTINTANLKPTGLANFNKPSTDYYQSGPYDFHSVMGYSSKTSSESVVYDVNAPMYLKNDQTEISQGTTQSDLDRAWLNYFYLPYIARTDVYAELAPNVYKSDNTLMTPQERSNLQAQLNNGNPNAPNCCRINNDLNKLTCP
ncbi:MAG: hypothetical protein EOO92_21655 [Pedobacter sp.]|nr:MAG: hypothetical protein EOO92_21655 [Pedobacter sp.]